MDSPRWALKDAAERVVAECINAAQTRGRHTTEMIAAFHQQRPATGTGRRDCGGNSRDRASVDDDITSGVGIRFHVFPGGPIRVQGSVL